MQTSATNRKIRVLLKSIREGSLIPRPEFQRRLVWSNKHKLAFIDTVISGYPFPEIYIAAGEVDPDTGEGTEMLVDGQQRITTLQQYFLGASDLKLGDLPAFSTLPQEKKIAFLEYEVVVRDLGSKTIDEIKEIFQRINSTKYSLNAMEVHHARFDGEFKKFAEQVSELPFFEMHRVFNTSDIKRMGDVRFCLTVIITILSTYFNRDNELEPFLEKYNDEFPESAKLLEELAVVLAVIDSFELPTNSRAWKKVDLLNLIVEIHRMRFKSQSIRIDWKLVGARLAQFYNYVDLVGTSETYPLVCERYHYAAVQATNDRSSRIRRAEVLQEIMESGFFDDPVEWKNIVDEI